MSSKSVVTDFINQKTLAVVGVSRKGNKFGNMVYKELKVKGYQVFAIHPEAEILEGDPVYRDFASLPVEVGGVVIVVQPAQTEMVVREAAAAGIKRVWMQQGSESPAAIQFCQENGMTEVHGDCIMMYAVNTGVHKFHGWVWRVLGLVPK
jgi:predicted CoA-binding protein